MNSIWPNDPRWQRAIFSVAIATLIAIAIGYRADFQDLFDLLTSVSDIWLLIGVICFTAYQVARADRMRRLIAPNIRPASIILTMTVQGFANNFLPSGLGEVMQIWLLRKRHGIDIPKGTGALVVARLSDLLVFIVFFGALLIFADDVPVEAQWVMLLVALVIVCVIIAVLIAARFASLITNDAWRHRLENFIHTIFSTRAPSLLIPLLVSSSVMWLLMYGVFYAVLNALGAELDHIAVIWIYILFFPVNILPIKGIASVGTHHLAWYLTLQFVGFAEPEAATFAFGAHLVMLTIVFLTAAPGLIAMAIRGINVLAQPEPSDNRAQNKSADIS